MANQAAMQEPTGAARVRFLLPLALAQFICSFAGSNMNVMINDISEDLDTNVQGVQLAITLFLLIMAILMIPGSKLTDRWGRKRCFIGGLTLYGIGALLSAASPGLGVLILGNSVLEGVGQNHGVAAGRHDAGAGGAGSEMKTRIGSDEG